MCAPQYLDKLSKMRFFLMVIRYTVPSTNLSYADGDSIFAALQDWAEIQTSDIPVSDYYCIKAFAEFWCASAYPECPDDSGTKLQLP